MDEEKKSKHQRQAAKIGYYKVQRHPQRDQASGVTQILTSTIRAVHSILEEL